MYTEDRGQEKTILPKLQLSPRTKKNKQKYMF